MSDKSTNHSPINHSPINHSPINHSQINHNQINYNRLESDANSEKKQKYIEAYISRLLMPYVLYLNMILSDNDNYKKIKKQKKNDGLNKINLYFLMEIIKKNIENMD